MKSRKNLKNSSSFNPNVHHRLSSPVKMNSSTINKSREKSSSSSIRHRQSTRKHSNRSSSCENLQSKDENQLFLGQLVEHLKHIEKLSKKIRSRHGTTMNGKKNR